MDKSVSLLPYVLLKLGIFVGVLHMPLIVSNLISIE